MHKNLTVFMLLTNICVYISDIGRNPKLLVIRNVHYK